MIKPATVSDSVFDKEKFKNTLKAYADKHDSASGNKKGGPPPEGQPDNGSETRRVQSSHSLTQQQYEEMYEEMYEHYGM